MGSRMMKSGGSWEKTSSGWQPPPGRQPPDSFFVISLSIKQADFNSRFRGEGYVMSYVTQKVLYSRIIQLNTRDGRVGYGEISSDPGLNLSNIRALENLALSEMEDMSLENLPTYLSQLRSRDVPLSGLAFALETAYLDLMSRHNGVPLYSLLGGK